MKKIHPLIYTAVCIALGVVLPIAFHAVPDAGRIFLPMHIPVLLCGLICGWPYGLICGIFAPVLSHYLTGMPPAAFLPSMLCELAAYGLFSGLLVRLIRTKKELLNLYVALVGAMLLGRALAGILNALIFSAGRYSLQIWLTGAFATALPGIVIQIVLLPALVFALKKAKLTE